MFKNNRINRIALVAAITVCSALTALAGNRITLGDGTPIAIKPGESKVIAVNLTNDEQIAGLQFDMEITSSNIEIVEGSLKVNEDRAGRDEFTTTLYHKADGKWRYTILTRPDAINVISGSEGTLGYFTIKANEKFRKDDNARILFSTCSGSTPEAEKAIIDIHESLAVTPKVGDIALGETAFIIKPGGTHRVDVVLNNEIDLYGMQTDIILPQGLHVAKNAKGKLDFIYSDRLPQEYAISSAERDGFVRVAIACLPVVKITGNSGTVFSFNVEADADFVSDENSKITFSNTLASDNAGALYTLETVNAVATVTRAKVQNDAAYKRLSEELAAVQARFDEVKDIIRTDYAAVASLFSSTELAIQTGLDDVAKDLKAKYDAFELDENSTLDIQSLKDAIEQLLEDAKKAYETTGVNGAWTNADGAGNTGIYTPNGTKVETPVKGMPCIIRYANGKNVKVVVK